jgi:methylenetetrahydrofolate--tRNA-(uracil-5-)-methyltransferase
LIPHIHVIGGGLAGTEAAWQLAERGFRVRLYEMRPIQTTDAHQTDSFAELVCSNSLKSDNPPSASWLLKQELRKLGSLLMRAAEKSRVPGGQALTVDRVTFAESVTEAIEGHPNIEVVREEVRSVDARQPTIVATGPLTSSALAASLSAFTGSDRLFFYDSISPIVDAHTINLEVVVAASRYDKSLDGTGD